MLRSWKDEHQTWENDEAVAIVKERKCSIQSFSKFDATMIRTTVILIDDSEYTFGSFSIYDTTHFLQGRALIPPWLVGGLDGCK